MQKIYINTASRTFYDASGNLFADGFPKLAYKRSERFVFQLCSESPDAGTEGCDPDTWEKDTQYELTGITGLLTLDNDYRRRRVGTLSEDVVAGSVASITAAIANVSAAVIRPSGYLRVFSDGTPEAFEYTSFSIDDGNTVTFVLAEGSIATGSYAAGCMVDVPDAVYMQAAMSNESNPETGLFIFDLVADSEKLRDKMEYADTSKLDDISGMELLLFTAANGEITECDSFVCSTVSVTATMAEANPNPQMPATFEDTLLAMIAAALSSGFNAQFSLDGTSWHDTLSDDDLYMRFRLVSTGNTGPWLVLKIGRNAFTYVAWASDASGTDFSLTPSASLSYRAELHTSTQIVSPTLADFSGVPFVDVTGISVAEAEIALRKSSTAYSVGDRVIYPGKTGYTMVCTTAGTSDASAPSFPASVTSGTTTLTDGTVTWTLYDETAPEIGTVVGLSSALSGKMGNIVGASGNIVVCSSGVGGGVKDSGVSFYTWLSMRNNLAVYDPGDRVYYPGKAGFILVCTSQARGRTGSPIPTWPSSVIPGTTTITDGEVTWTIYDATAPDMAAVGGLSTALSAKAGNSDVSLLARSTAYAVGDRVIYPGKAGYTLVCTTAGTSASSVPAFPISVVSGTTTLTDGTAVWTLYDSVAPVSGQIGGLQTLLDAKEDALLPPETATISAGSWVVENKTENGTMPASSVALVISTATFPVGSIISLRVDNSSGGTLTMGATELIGSGDTDVYLLSFVNMTGTIEVVGSKVALS